MTPKPLAVTWSCFLLACAAPHNPGDPGGGTGGTAISAAAGGTVLFGNDVTLVIPPGSLAEDTTIGVVPEPSVPVGDADGFAASGAAFRFSPPGTQFDLAKPAILTMHYDPEALSAQGLDPRTLELAYFDEALGRYNSIGGVFDPTTGTITAKVEHFTLYVPMAIALLPGDNPPTVALQSPVPNPIRAGAPLYLRATIRDYDIAGSIAGADLYISVNNGQFTKLSMHPEATLDTFAALVPSASVGTTLDYYVVATDNLGRFTTSGTTHVAVAHQYTAGSLSLTPGSQAIAAGFDKLFAAKGVDETAAAFALVPDSVNVTNGIGLVSSNVAGVNFSARTVGIGAVQVMVGADVANATVAVSNGPLTSVAILDKNGVPIQGTLVIQEGSRTQLDAVGQDAWGNQILINPTWSTSSSNGAISSSGLLDALDADQAGSVTATIGDVVGTQWFWVNQRSWNTATILDNGTPTSTDLAQVANRNGTPYVAYAVSDGGIRHVHVGHYDGTQWVDDGSPNAASANDTYEIAIAAGTSRLEVAWMENAQLYAAHLEGTTWVQDGGALEVDVAGATVDTSNVGGPSLAFAGDTPWLAWHELGTTGRAVHVRHWNGTAWILDGGQIEDAGTWGYSASIAILAGVPYVAYAQYPYPDSRVFVKRWDGTSWQPVGGTLNALPGQRGEMASIAMVAGTPTVAFRQYLDCCHVQLYVLQWTGSSWGVIGAALADTGVVTGVSLTADGDVPYLAFTEYSPATGIARRATHYNPRTGVWGDLGGWGTWAAAGTNSISIAIVGTTPFMANAEQFDRPLVRVQSLR